METQILSIYFPLFSTHGSVKAAFVLATLVSAPFAGQAQQTDPAGQAETLVLQLDAAFDFSSLSELEKALVALAHKHGCQLTQTTALSGGATLADTQDVLLKWIDQGLVTYSARTVTFGAAICASPDVAVTRNLGWKEAPIAKPAAAPKPLIATAAPAVAPAPAPKLAAPTARLKKPAANARATNPPAAVAVAPAPKPAPPAPAPTYTPPPPTGDLPNDVRNPQLRTTAMANLITMIRLNGCVINEQEAAEFLPSYGMTPEQARPLAQQLEAQGYLIVEDPDAYLSPLLCGAHGLDPYDYGSRANSFLTYVEDSGCSVTSSTAMDIMIEDVGFNLDNLPTLVDILIQDGTVALDDSDQTLFATTQYCGY